MPRPAGAWIWSQSCLANDAMIASVIALAVAGLSGASSTMAPSAGKVLWLVQPLYPGQETLATRVEEEIRQRLSSHSRMIHVVGPADLAAALQGKSVDLRCLLGEAACSKPFDAAVAELGFREVLLLRAGQEEL